MTKRASVAAIAALAMACGAVASPASATAFVAADELMKACQSTADEDRSFCFTYIMGVVDTNFTFLAARPDLPKLFCLPAGVQAAALAQGVVTYLSNHPDELKYAAADETTLALAKTYPCR